MALPKIKIKYDGKVRIATGASRTSLSWTNTELTWSELVSRLSVPLRTHETQAEYKSWPKAKRDAVKDVGGFVGGVLKAGRRKAENVQLRTVLTLDLDSIPRGIDIWPSIELDLDCAAVMYSTHSNTETAKRLRLVFPLSRPVSPDEYGAISRRIAADIGIDYCDDTTYEAHRLMYWASCSIDADYIFEYVDSPWLNVDEVLSSYADWRDTSEWPLSSRKSELNQRQAKKQGDPLTKKGYVGAFCNVYDIPLAISTFLPDVYEPVGDGRYTYKGGSTIGGLVLYEDGKFAYSHHGTDPISGMLVNAFDLVRVHKFGFMDEDADSNSHKKPASYTQMVELASEDEAVRYQMMTDALDFEDMDEDTEWLKALELTGKGQIAQTIDNVVIIMQNDPRLKGKYYFDVFSNRPVVSDDLPWKSLDDRDSARWNDSDDAALWRFLQKEYRIDSAAIIRAAVENAMLEAERHPVREYLTGLTWDGIERAETLFIDYLCAEDSEYTRAVTRASLIGAVARIMKPGCKHDHMLILVGPQGCGKSTTLSMLGKTWFSDSLYTLTGKEALEQIQGHWIIEMGELAATKKAEVEQIKQFVSKQVDSFRAAYARRTAEHPRQCAFFGSTNEEQFLKDPTGARRFWPVVVTGETDLELTAEIVDQIWAETVTYYNAGEKWHLGKRAEALARRVQAEHTEESAQKGVIEKFLEKKVPIGWDTYTLEQRLNYWACDFESEEEAAVQERTKVCAAEIHAELFKGRPTDFTIGRAREINTILRSIPGWKAKSRVNCGAYYGQQRGFIRASEV